MSGPPDIEPSELWAKLQTSPRPHKIVNFPRFGANGESLGEVAIWVLTQEEQMAANAEAERFARKLLKDAKRGDIGYEALFDNEGAVQVLYRACRDPKNLKRSVFPAPSSIREALTADEVGRLFEHYMTTQLELGPTISRLSEEEFEAWVTKLAEGQTFFFDLLSSELRKILAFTMAKRLHRSWTDKSFVGSLLDDDTSNGSLENENDIDAGDELNS